MRRKLIQHGLSSLTLSLPRKWIKENNLEKGEELEIEETKDKLIITTKRHYPHKKIELDVSNSDPMIRRIIGATYRAGYDEVDINFNSYEELKQIQNLIREQFTGFEIINQTKDSIKIKNLSQINFDEFHNVLRRFFLVLLQLSEETSQAMEKDDFKWLKNLSLLKKESDKFADYCRRAINLGFETELKRTSPLYTIIEQLEKVVDRYTELCEYISDNKIILNKEIKEFPKELYCFIELFYKIFYKFEINKIIEFGKNKGNLQKSLDKILFKCKKEEIKIIILLDKILNLIFDLNGPAMAVYI